MGDAMTDDLVKRLEITGQMISLGERVSWGVDSALMAEAAARIAELERQLTEARLKSLADLGQAQEAWEAQKAAEAQVAKLVEALTDHNDLLRSAMQIAKREGVEGQIASTNWDAYYNRVAVVLKRHHATANKARAALSTVKREGEP